MGMTIESGPDGRTVRFDGRILFLTEDPELIRKQLAGEDLDWDPAIKLRDDISTDEITPVWVCYHYDEKLGEYPYVGLECQGERPIGQNDVKGGGFVACVSGKRRGKGFNLKHGTDSLVFLLRVKSLHFCSHPDRDIKSVYPDWKGKLLPPNLVFPYFGTSGSTEEGPSICQY